MPLSELESTSNRVYIASSEFGWIPAKVLVAANGKKVKVSFKDYPDDESIPACEVSLAIGTSSQAPSHRIHRGSKDKRIPLKEMEVDLLEYPGHVLPLQNVDEDGRLIEVPDMVDLSFLHEVCVCVCSARVHFAQYAAITLLPLYLR